MLILPPVDIKGPLSGLVSNAILDLAPEHHLGAAHIIVHNVLQFRQEGLQVHQEKVNLVVCRYLDPHVALDVVDEASNVDGVVVYPLLSLSQFVQNDLEEQDLAGASNN